MLVVLPELVPVELLVEPVELLVEPVESVEPVVLLVDPVVELPVEESVEPVELDVVSDESGADEAAGVDASEEVVVAEVSLLDWQPVINDSDARAARISTLCERMNGTTADTGNGVFRIAL